MLTGGLKNRDLAAFVLLGILETSVGMNTEKKNKHNFSLMNTKTYDPTYQQNSIK